MKPHFLAGFVAGAGLLFAAVAALAQTGAGAVPAQKEVVKVGVTGRPDQASLVLALKRGYWDRQGLDVQFVAAGNAAQDSIAALANDQIQVSGGSPSAGLVNALNRGIDIRMVADWAHVGTAADTTFSLSVRADLISSGEVKTISDLKGRTVAVGPVKGGVNDLFLTRLLQKGNLTVADIKPQFIAFPDGLAALASKKLDAAMLIEPMVGQAAAQGIAKTFVTAGSIIPGAQVAMLFYSPQFAAKKDAATRFMIGYLQGVRDYYDAFELKKDQDAAIAILTANLALKDPNVWKNSASTKTDLNGRFNVPSIKEQANYFKQEGLVDGPVPDIDKYVDTSFIDAAVKKIGER